MLIGHGVVNWQKFERVCDRYGSIHLSETGWDENYVKFPKEINGKKGELIAIIRETKQSRHIGDFARGLSPQPMKVGDKVVLGSGTIFFEEMSIGLKPDEDREYDWMNPESLYKVHDQTIDLYFEQIDLFQTTKLQRFIAKLVEAQEAFGEFTEDERECVLSQLPEGMEFWIDDMLEELQTLPA